MKKRAAFCPQCSSWLQFVHIVPDINHPAVGLGRHVWFCPHCISVCDTIMENTVSVPHSVTCSICGSTDPRLVHPDTKSCPSCNSAFTNADWESKQTLPSQKINNPSWSQLLTAHPDKFMYRLTTDLRSS